MPETHTFVLPVGEVTVTLEDVAHIFGLPIDGEPVSGWTDSSSDFVHSQSMAIFGREPVLSRNSKSYIKLGWVRRIRDAEPLDIEESIRRYVRCQIFCMLGSTLFTDKSTTYAHAKYIPLLRDFEWIHTYSWGSACLAHLYRVLCRASRYDTKEMDGPLNLLTETILKFHKRHGAWNHKRDKINMTSSFHFVQASAMVVTATTSSKLGSQNIFHKGNQAIISNSRTPKSTDHAKTHLLSPLLLLMEEKEVPLQLDKHGSTTQRWEDTYENKITFTPQDINKITKMTAVTLH
ncbi:hypothetical protein AHAS_Ahas10G0140400 [Arachis hypogaea]